MTKSKTFIISLLIFIFGLSLSLYFSPRLSSRLISQSSFALVTLLIILIFFPEKPTRVFAIFVLALFCGFLYPIVLNREVLFNFPFPKLISILNNFKNNFNANLAKALISPFAQLSSGLVVGTSPDFPKDLKNAFIATGTIHLVAVSGFNITIVLKIFCNNLKVFGPKIAFYFGTLAILLFVIMVGGQASVVRAAIMGWLFLLCWFLGRMPNIFNALVFAGFCMILIEPKIVTELSFQLSFASMLGLIFFDPVIRLIKLPHIYVNHVPLPKWDMVAEFIPKNFRDAFVATIAAQLMTMPLIVMVFGRLSILSPIPNFLIVPLASYAMIMTIIVGVVGFINSALAQLIAWPLWILLKYFIIVINFFAKINFVSVNVPKWNFWLVLLYYLILFGIYYLLKRKNKLNSSPKNDMFKP